MVSANAFPVMGGVETHVHEVAPRIARAGFDVTVLTTDRSGRLPQREEVGGVHVRRVRAMPAERDYYFAPGIYRHVARGGWDLLHCQGVHTLVPPLAMLAGQRARIPYVLTLHSGGHGSRTRTRLRGAQHQLLRPLLSRARRLIAVSQWEADSFAGHLRLPRDRFVTIPNGADLDWAANVPAVEEDPSLILSVGRLERYKGHQRAIAAMPHLLRHVPDARLRIVGAGSYESELRRLAHRSGLEERIEIGSVDARDRPAMAALLARAGLVVLLSEYESHGIAVLEALALRRRVLVADSSALSEFAANGLARAVPLDSAPDELARIMHEQLRAAPPTGFQLPTWDACADQLVSLYRQILKR
jgi:glycosyltransferase involved in cell wall biosynthesis